MSKPDASRYRTTNWKSCNAALVRHGSLLIWLDKGMVRRAPKAGRNGRPPVALLHKSADIRELERQLGRKTLEAEILREALDKSRSKKQTLLARSPLKGDFQ